MTKKNPGLYIHIPYCRSKCPYCDFYSLPIAGQRVPEMMDALLWELGQYRLDAVQTLYIGGGSPSCLPDEQFLRLLGTLEKYTAASPEFTIEVNPGQIRLETLKIWRKYAVNRISIGAQSFHQPELDLLGRQYRVSQIQEAVRLAREAGFTNINLDLIFAIPGSNLVSWRQNLETALTLPVQHISAYSLTYEHNTPFSHKRAQGELDPVGEEADRAMYELTIGLLQKAGFVHYEISNFARPGWACEHNLIYWNNLPYIGIGPAAGSWWQGRRRTNRPSVSDYLNAVQNQQLPPCETEIPDPIQVACETAVLNLRKISGINLPQFKQQTGYDALQLFAAPIAKFQQSQLLALRNDHLALTPQALPIADTVLCEFSSL